MGGSSSNAERADVLEILVPKTFRHCVTDLSTEKLTKKEKEMIDRYVRSYVETYNRTKERTAEQFLLSDYADFLY